MFCRVSNEPVLRLVERGINGGGHHFAKWNSYVVVPPSDEAERLRAGIQYYLDGNWGHKFTSKHDQCPHGRFGWEDCGQCIDKYFQGLLDTIPPA